jgi:hypothetical protein
MSLARNLARLIVDASGNIDASNLDNAVPADGSITEAKLANSAVTDAKIAAMAASKLTGQVPDANAPSGSVIQVVSATKTDTQTFSGTGSLVWVDLSGLSVSITPTSASNKILIIANVIWTCENSSGVRLVRNSTGICVGDSAGSRTQASSVQYYTSNTYNMMTAPIMHLDNPSTTSATTYKLQGYSAQSATFKVNRANTDSDNFEYIRSASSITVMEIAA